MPFPARGCREGSTEMSLDRGSRISSSPTIPYRGVFFSISESRITAMPSRNVAIRRNAIQRSHHGPVGGVPLVVTHATRPDWATLAT